MDLKIILTTNSKGKIKWWVTKTCTKKDVCDIVRDIEKKCDARVKRDDSPVGCKPWEVQWMVQDNRGKGKINSGEREGRGAKVANKITLFICNQLRWRYIHRNIFGLKSVQIIEKPKKSCLIGVWPNISKNKKNSKEIRHANYKKQVED